MLLLLVWGYGVGGGKGGLVDGGREVESDGGGDSRCFYEKWEISNTACHHHCHPQTAVTEQPRQNVISMTLVFASIHPSPEAEPQPSSPPPLSPPPLKSSSNHQIIISQPPAPHTPPSSSPPFPTPSAYTVPPLPSAS